MASLDDIRQLLDHTLQLEGRGMQLQADSLLFGALPELDSMAVVAVLTAIEEQWGLMIDDGDIDAEAFATLGALQDFVNRQLQAATPKAASAAGD